MRMGGIHISFVVKRRVVQDFLIDEERNGEGRTKLKSFFAHTSKLYTIENHQHNSRDED